MVGFDDIYPGSLCEPPLTTVRQPMRLLGERACDRLLERIADPALRRGSSCCPPSSSSGPAAAARPGRSARQLIRGGRLAAGPTGCRHPSGIASEAPGPEVGEGMSFMLRRLAFYVVAAWVALTVNFFIPRAMPGNAVQDIMAKFPNLQPSAYKALEAMLGVGHPGSLWHQYVTYLDDVAHFNFGTDVDASTRPRCPRCSAETDPVDAHAGRHRDGHRLPGRHRGSASWPAGGTAAGWTGRCPA